MAHIRNRFVKLQVKDALRFSPIVGLIGQRQVGKTTLAETFGNYITFDDATTLQMAESLPSELLPKNKKLLVIDECQKSPKIFPALKLAVQRDKRPGQFLLTGSVRFTGRKAIQESLTGRIVNIEILPLTIAEMANVPCQDFSLWSHLSEGELNSQFKKRTSNIPKGIIKRYLDRGGLPAFWSIREPRFVKDLMRTHLETLLQRDVQLLVQTTVPYVALLELLRFIAIRQGGPLNMSEISRSTQISPNTLKKIISAFENMFLIRRVLGLGYVKAPAFYLEDQGMASYLNGGIHFHEKLRFAFSQLFAQVHYSTSGNFSVAHYFSRGGANVELAFRIENRWIGFALAKENSPQSTLLKSAQSFLENIPESSFVILHPSISAFKRLSNRIMIAPLIAVA